jgi:DNA-binding NtrC family response regulator
MVDAVQAVTPEIAQLDDESLITLPGLQETPAPAPAFVNGHAHNGANGENGVRSNGANGIHPDTVVPLKTFLREQEQTHLNRVMDQCGGDKERAAIALGVSLATLYRKLSGEEKE